MKTEIRRRRVVSAIETGFGSEAAAPAQAFMNRVLADSGSFEAQSCLESQIIALGSFYGQSSFILTPNGFKVAKLYALKPTDGSGDLTFSRTTNGWRKNSALLQEMPVDVPRLDYLGLTCPSLLLEPARTNLILRSEAYDQAAWTKTNTTAADAYDITTLPNLQGANGVWVADGYSYIVSNGGNALNIFDVADPYNPVFKSKITTSGGPIGVVVIDNFALVTCNTGNCINIFDITDKTSPVLSTTVSNGGGINLDGPWNGIYRAGYFYVGTNTAIQVFSYSAGTLTATDNIAAVVVTNLDVVGNYIYYVSFSGDLFGIIDATDKANLAQLDTITNGTDGAALDQAHDVVVSANGNVAIVCARASNSINVFDTSNKSAIAVTSVLTDGTNLVGVESMVWNEGANLLYVVNLTGDDFVILSTANLALLSILGQVNTNLDGSNKLYLSGNYTHIACLDGSIYSIIDVSVSAAPFRTASVHDSNSFKILETVTNATHQVQQAFTKATSALPYIIEHTAKGGVGRDYICLQADDGTNGQGQFFNLTTGALGGQRTIGAGFTIVEAKIVDMGAEGYKCIIRVSSSTSSVLNVRVLLSTDGTTISYAGDITKGYYARKTTLIQSASPLTESYITTAAAGVSRTADTITALTSYSANIGQTEGTLFFWVKTTWADSVSKAVSISDGTANNRVMIDFTSGNVINALVVSGGVTQATISNASFLSLTEYKVAITYQNNKAALFVNGTKVGEDLTVTVPACSRIGFDNGAGSNPFYGNISAFSISKTALSDADAQTLTTI